MDENIKVQRDLETIKAQYKFSYYEPLRKTEKIRFAVIVMVFAILFFAISIYFIKIFSWNEIVVWAIFSAMVTWLGKVWIQRISNYEKFYHDKCMVLFKNH